MSSPQPEQHPDPEAAWTADIEVPRGLVYADTDEVEALLPEVVAELTPVFDEAGI
jgi:hypothetical protein